MQNAVNFLFVFIYNQKISVFSVNRKLDHSFHLKRERRTRKRKERREREREREREKERKRERERGRRRGRGRGEMREVSDKMRLLFQENI